MVSRKSSNELKHNFPHHQQKLNVILNICPEENTKTIDYFLVDNKPEPWDDSKPSVVVKGKKIDYEYFNLIIQFLVSLVVSFVGYRFKLLSMSWYKCMTRF